jgi:hypothetical protein
MPFPIIAMRYMKVFMNTFALFNNDDETGRLKNHWELSKMEFCLGDFPL